VLLQRLLPAGKRGPVHSPITGFRKVQGVDPAHATYAGLREDAANDESDKDALRLSNTMKYDYARMLKMNHTKSDIQYRQKHFIWCPILYHILNLIIFILLLFIIKFVRTKSS